MPTERGALRRLHLGHCMIFLSHSGADKDFVRILHEALEMRGYSVFFDEKSLPKAEQLSMEDILEELKTAKLAVVLLSKDFLTRTPHPMRELNVIVLEKIKMLPIFYDFRVDEFKEKCKSGVWQDSWRMWVEQGQISEDTFQKWKAALKVVSGTNGLEYCKEATNNLDLRDRIVDRVAQILKPNRITPWGDSNNLQGMDELCKIISKRFKKIEEDLQQPSVSATHSSTVVLGIHGISGIGKTSLSRALCQFYFKGFYSHICHIDVGDQSTDATRERLKCVLQWLTKMPLKNLEYPTTTEEAWNLFEHNIVMLCGRTRPFFLAIDNVKNEKCKEEAERYLRCGPFPMGSKILLTSQSANLLENLTSHNMNFPDWTFRDAREIFCHSLGPTTASEQQVDECVKMCTLNKSKEDYHPLMLVVLASFMRQTSRDPRSWQEKLEVIKKDGVYASTSMHTNNLEVLFRCLYDSLTEDQQHMLLDLALCLPDVTWDRQESWLEHFYPNQNIDRIILDLKDVSLMETGYSRSKGFRVHDAVREFLKKESKEGWGCIFNMEHETVKHSWQPARPKRPHQGRHGSECIYKLRVSRCQFEHPTLDLSDFKEIGMLHLIANKGLECVQLSQKAWRSLQSLVVEAYDTTITIEVADIATRSQVFHVDLKRCKFKSQVYSDIPAATPWKRLVSLQLQNVTMCEQLGLCIGEIPHLEKLSLANLSDVRKNLNLDRCLYITKIMLVNMPNLEAILGLEKCLKVESLWISQCQSLCSLVLLDKSAQYDFYDCEGLGNIEVLQYPQDHAGMRGERREEGSSSELREGEIRFSDCPLVRIIGLSGRNFIRRVWFGAEDPKQGPACSTERVKSVFENCGSSIEPHDRPTANVEQFCYDVNNMSFRRIHLADVRGLSHYIKALASHSGLSYLGVSCREHDDCGCNSPHQQPRFDILKGGLKELSLQCRSVVDISSLENCGLLEELNLQCRSVVDISSLENCGLLERLNLQCRSVVDISSLESCSLLQTLGLYGCASAVVWPDFGKMTSLRGLRVESPSSLAHWPRGLRRHPSLRSLLIYGSSQIGPEELLQVVTSVDTDTHLREDILASYSALHYLVGHHVYSSRKCSVEQEDIHLQIAQALMSNSEKLLSIIDRMLAPTCPGHEEEVASRDDPKEAADKKVAHEIGIECRLKSCIDCDIHRDEVKDYHFFNLLSQLLYGLWVEADCHLHEYCTQDCTSGSGRNQMQEIQECLRPLLSSYTMISALLRTIPAKVKLVMEKLSGVDHLLLPAFRFPDFIRLFDGEGVVLCKVFHSCYSYESLVVVYFASVKTYKVSLEGAEPKLVNEIQRIVQSFFDEWRRHKYRRLPLRLRDVILENSEVTGKLVAGDEVVFKHDLSAVRVADAVCRLADQPWVRSHVKTYSTLAACMKRLRRMRRRHRKRRASLAWNDGGKQKATASPSRLPFLCWKQRATAFLGSRLPFFLLPIPHVPST